MITISLKDFILSAKFGSVKMGWNLQKVIEILGKPVSETDYGTGSYGISYSGYQLFFFDDELHYIQNDHLKADCINQDEWIDFKNEKIIIQGDYRDRIMEILKQKGFSVKRVGG